MRQLLLGFVLGLTTATAAQPTPGGTLAPSCPRFPVRVTVPGVSVWIKRVGGRLA